MDKFLKKYKPIIDESLINEIFFDQPNPLKQRRFFSPLNRTYLFEINNSPLIPTNFTKKIQVPFSVESKLSNINIKTFKNKFYHYHNTFNLKKELEYVFLNILRIDGKYKIYLNGKEIKSGIDDINIEIDITEYLIDSSNTLDICIEKSNDYSLGITGQVYFNQAGSSLIKSVKTYVNNDNTVSFIIDSVEPNGHLLIRSPLGEAFEYDYDDLAFKIPLKQIVPYTASSPFVYQYEIKNKDDVYKSSFAILNVSTGKKDNIPCILINNNPTPIVGVIDDTLYPFSNLSHPSNTFIKDHQTNIKNLGFNSIFISNRIELPFYYYNALLKGFYIVNRIKYQDREKFIKTIEYLREYDNNYLYIIENKTKESDEDIYNLAKLIVKNKLVCVGKYQDIKLIKKHQLNLIKASSIILDLSFTKQVEGFEDFMENKYIKYSLKGLNAFYYNSYKNKNPLITVDNIVRLKSYKRIQNALNIKY